MNGTVQTIVTILATALPATLLAAIANTLMQRRKIKAEAIKYGADAAAVFTETATELVAPLRKELSETRAELADARAEMAAMRTHLVLFEGLLREHEIPAPKFVWPPNGGTRRERRRT